MPANPLVKRALQVAEGRLGMEELAARLKAHSSTVIAWRDGHATMPERKFLLLVDVLTELDPSWTDWDRQTREQ